MTPGQFSLGGVTRGITFPTPASSFKPTNIAGCVLWLRAQDIVGADGSSVTTWADKSGTGNDAVAGAAPVLKLAVKNGLNVVRYDGTKGLIAPSLDVPSYTLIAVYNTSDATMSQRVISTSTNSLIGPFGTQTELYDGGFSSGPAPTNGVFVVHTGIHTDAVGGANFVNGSPQGTTTGTQTLGTALGIGSNSSASGGFLSGDIAEVIVYNTAISSTNRGLVEAYLLSEYALP